MDHQMVWSQVCLSIKPPCRLNAAKPPQKLNTIKLKHYECADALRSCMEIALSRLVENPPDNITDHWNAFKNVHQFHPKHLGESQVQTTGLVWQELPICTGSPLN